MLQEAFFRSIQGHYDSSLPFVVYRKPDSDVVKALLQNDVQLYRSKDLTETGFVFAPFQETQDPVIIPLSASEQLTIDQVEIEANEDRIISEVNDESDKRKHIALVNRGIDAIALGALKKVVLSRAEHVSISNTNPLDLFKALLSSYNAAMAYLWYHPKVGVWLGASPESLLKVDGKRFQTMALAGTRPYDGSLDVKWDDKNLAEQDMVTSYISSELESFSTQMHVDPVQTVQAGNMLHLRSEIRGVLKSNLSKDLIARLHPTPAVCGYPTSLAKAFILANELYDREFYTGYFGELNFRTAKSRNSNRKNVENNAYASITVSSDLYVNLRCMQIKGREAIVYVGGGITKDSTAEEEWDETVNKSHTMKQVLI